MGLFDFISSTVSPNKFAKIFLASARKQGFQKAMTYDASDFRFFIDNDKSNIFHLTNAYRDYRNAEKAERENVLSKYTSSLEVASIPTSFNVAKSHILPAIRAKGLGESLRITNLMQKNDSPLDQLFIPFSADADMMLAYDTEQSIQMVGMTVLESWGVSAAEAMAVAFDNLRDRTIDQFGDLGDGIWVGQWNDSYDTSRVLLPDVAYRSNVGSNPVMMIPTRGCFLLTSSNNVTGQLKMIEYARESVERDGRVISALMYRFQDGKVIEYISEDEFVIQKMANFNREYVADDYASQKDFLDKLHDSEGTDIFVASFSIATNTTTGNITSFCSWTKDVDSLLPKTDVVAMVDLDAFQKYSIKYIAWADAIALDGYLLPDANTHPIRYRATQFPSAEQLRAIPEVEL